MDISLAVALTFFSVSILPWPAMPAIRYSNRKVGGIRFMRVGRVFCSFGVSR